MQENYEVLVLDDEAIVCERLQDYLRKKGYGVETFTQSESALKRLEEKYFDVVITDIKMAGPNGMDVLISIKNHNTATEVIIITGYPDYETIRTSEVKEAFAYITKPFKLDELEKKISKAAKKARKMRKKAVSKSSV